MPLNVNVNVNVMFSCMVMIIYSEESPISLTRQHPKALDDLQPSLLQGDPVLADHQTEHDQGHKLAGVRLEPANKTRRSRLVSLWGVCVCVCVCVWLV